MMNRWSEEEAAAFLGEHGGSWGEDLALRIFSSRLLGQEESLVLHGGGNTSVKTTRFNRLGERIPAILVKASGHDLAGIGPEGHPALDLEYLKRLRALPELTDEEMVNELRTHLFDAGAATPSLETLVHAFIPRKFIDHTHADAILALTNQADGESLVQEALGSDVITLPYVTPGFKLALAAAAAFEARPSCRGMVLMRHGLMTWGDTARESYEATIEFASKAEAYLSSKASRPLSVPEPTPLPVAQERWLRVAPLLRGLLSEPSGCPDQPYRRVILQGLIDRQVLDFVDSDRGKELALTPPLTSDHLIRTKPFPLWIEAPDFDNPDGLRKQLSKAIQDYAAEHTAYIKRHAGEIPAPSGPIDSLPRVILVPGMGAVTAGKDLRASRIARDITAHTLAVKARIAAMGMYRGMDESEMFEMEYRTIQQAKLGPDGEPPLGRHVALITGAAGAIGAGISGALLEVGCHVGVTDLPGENLERLESELRGTHGDRVIAVPLDVTDAESVRKGFQGLIETWGGIDLIVVNAGIALVSSLEEMDIDAFRRLERVNVEGTLLVLAEAARHFKDQGIGGDIVVVSSKNVFAPGAKFGAYSATKAASHQLARIASLELADLGVRVNMISPDAVFSHGTHRSGLWAEIGPDRMRARGLDERGLEEYYQKRNLLKARVTARHVANAVLFFATRQTPTTGSTIPVDGGLPDATPR